MDRLLPWLRDPFRARDFACEVVASLSPGDFCSTDKRGMDEYGIALGDDLQSRHGVEGLVTWYVKLSLERRRDGQTVLLASLHQPERDFDERRVGGPLKVEFKRRSSP